MTKPDRILIVDDEPDLEVLIRQQFRKRIRANEIDFAFASNGREALDFLGANGDIEIVFTDINMPVMDGLTLLSEVRKLNRLIKAVVISAYGDLENIRTAMNLGAFDFLTKPIDLSDLDTTLDKTLQEIAVHKVAAQNRAKLIGLEQELLVASQIQQAMLPVAPPHFWEHSQFDLFAMMSPAKAVGGDFYDFFKLDGERLAIVIGDVSGKGIPAALLMMLARVITKSAAMHAESPATCIAQVNRFLHAERVSHRFVTLFYGVFDVARKTLNYCNAGHNPPLLVHRDGTVQSIPLVGGMVTGVDPDNCYDCASLEFHPGDALVLYSDGVTEAMNLAFKPYGDDRLERVLRDARGDARAIVEAILNDVRAYVQDAEQSDDLTVVVVKSNE